MNGAPCSPSARHMFAFLSTRLNGLKSTPCMLLRDIRILNIRVITSIQRFNVVNWEAIEENVSRSDPFCIAVYGVHFNKFQKLQSHCRLVRSSCIRVTEPEGSYLLNAARYCLYSKCERLKHRFYTAILSLSFLFLYSDWIANFFIDYCSTETSGYWTRT